MRTAYGLVCQKVCNRHGYTKSKSELKSIERTVINVTVQAKGLQMILNGWYQNHVFDISDNSDLGQILNAVLSQKDILKYCDVYDKALPLSRSQWPSYRVAYFYFNDASEIILDLNYHHDKFTLWLDSHKLTFNKSGQHIATDYAKLLYSDR